MEKHNAAYRLNQSHQKPIATRLNVANWVQLPSGLMLNLDHFAGILEPWNNSTEKGWELKLKLSDGNQATTIWGDDAIALANYLGATIPPKPEVQS